MRSLSKVVKGKGSSEAIQPYDFLSGFQIIQEATAAAEGVEEGEEALESVPEMTPEEILEQAKAKAEEILSDAREQAEILRTEAFEQGKQEGAEEGYQAAHEEQRQLLKQQTKKFQQDFTAVLQSVSVEKDKILETYIDDLKKVTLAVAEKIIQTSLHSSGDIIKRMILAATDKMKKRQWAKIYITKCNNVGVSMEVDAEFLESLSALSDNIKIITMDNGEEGTCIIELPDEIVDASVGTQLENIKDILNNARV